MARRKLNDTNLLFYNKVMKEANWSMLKAYFELLQWSFFFFLHAHSVCSADCSTKPQSERRCVPFSITEWFSISSVFLRSGLAHTRTKRSFFTVANASENKFYVLPPFCLNKHKSRLFFFCCRDTTLYFCISRKAFSEKRPCFHFR